MVKMSNVGVKTGTMMVRSTRYVLLSTKCMHRVKDTIKKIKPISDGLMHYCILIKIGIYI